MYSLLSDAVLGQKSGQVSWIRSPRGSRMGDLSIVLTDIDLKKVTNSNNNFTFSNENHFPLGENVPDLSKVTKPDALKQFPFGEKGETRILV